MSISQNPGLYVHVPFCRIKCPYCGFFSLTSTSLISRWLDSFEKEAAFYKGRFHRFDSLYLGGGTPTSLSIRDLARVMAIIRADFSFASDTEITIEANPCDLSHEVIDSLKALGVNRIIVGVQSFNDRELTFLKRRHTAGDAEKALKYLRASGFKNIGIDLIYGLEGQSPKSWLTNLKQALVFQPEHLSCYQLIFEKRTPFFRMREKGLIQPMGEQKERAFFLMTSTFLENNGYIHYEISSFARGKAYYGRHNYKYWSHIPYLGLGPSAHSFQNSTRWWNFRSVRRYYEALKNHKVPVENYETLSGEQIRLESILLGLRKIEGFSLKEPQPSPNLNNTISRLEGSGFLKVEGDRIVPTKKGFLVADYLPLCFSQGL